MGNCVAEVNYIWANTSLFNIENWTVDADPEVFSRASLSIDGTAMYLSVRPPSKPGLQIMIR